MITVTSPFLRPDTPPPTAGDCPKEITGKVAVSLEVIADWGLTVRGLDGVARV